MVAQDNPTQLGQVVTANHINPRHDETLLSSGAEELRQISGQSEASTKKYDDPSWKDEYRRKPFRKVKTEKLKRRLAHSSEDSEEAESEDDAKDNVTNTKTVPAKKQKVEDGNKHPCNMCDKALANPFSLKRHKQKIHDVVL